MTPLSWASISEQLRAIGVEVPVTAPRGSEPPTRTDSVPPSQPEVPPVQQPARMDKPTADAPKGRTLTFVERSEGAGVEIAKRIVARTAVMHADEGSHWDALHAGWQVHRINHSEAYCTGDACTNQAESFFSRLRRMVRGQHHYVSPQYLHQYAAHAAWLEDHHREDNGALVHRALGLAMAHPVSRQWKGYWQR